MKTTSGSVTEEGGGKRGLDSQQMKKVGGGIRPACGERVQMRVRNFVGYGLLHQIHHRRAGRVAGGDAAAMPGSDGMGAVQTGQKEGFSRHAKKADARIVFRCTRLSLREPPFRVCPSLCKFEFAKK